jgi:hypothetical protein
MATTQTTTVTAARVIMIQSLALLAVAVAPWPERWTGLRSVIASTRSSELNRAEREVEATGYYEGLIGGDEGANGARGELALRLMGKPNGWVRFNDAGVSRLLPGDFLQFELVEGIRRVLFGQPFITNSHGMHSPEVTLAKPPGTFRIAVLGASMDMGWGVSYRETYSHLLEEWLNRHGRQLGVEGQRRFEVLNFAVAAYSPLQRLETLRRKALAFRPDLVLYSATMLDLRLMEIHLCDALRSKANLSYDFLSAALDGAGISQKDLQLDDEGQLIHKDQIKTKLRGRYWELYDATLGALAGECRSAGVPLLFVIVPRVGKADALPYRAEPVARLKAIAGHQALPVYDLSDTYDRFDPATLEIAAWDDHPNALGHRRLFLALARSLVKNQQHYLLLFPTAPPQGKVTNNPLSPLAGTDRESALPEDRME